MIVTAMAAATGIFNDSEIAVMITVVLLTTLFTPLVMRGAFLIRCPQETEEDSEENGASEYNSTIVESHAEA